MFAAEESLGKEDAERALAQKREKAREFSQYPVLSEYPLVSIKEKIRKALIEAYGEDFILAIPPAEADADIAIACFGLAKKSKEDSKETAKKISNFVSKKSFSFVSEASAAGGYANIRIDKTALGAAVLRQINKIKESYGASREGADRLVVVEYSSPNVAKPMSVGHLRSTIIGESLKRVYEFGGYAAVGVNHLGDFGTQFGKLLCAYQAWRDETAFKKDPIKEMLRLYVKFHEAAKDDLALDEEARKLFLRLESGDPELVKLWLEFCVVSLEEFEKIYEKLGVKIDLTLGESFYETMLEAAADELLDKKIATRNDDGSVAVNFPDEVLPSFLLKKKDSSSLYALRDIASAVFRIKTFAPEKIIYVVGGEQKLHFQQVFKTLALSGYDPKIFRHDSFGMVSLPEGKMSTREGRVVFLEDLIAEAKARSLEIIRQKEPDLPRDEQERRAEKIGTAAIIYNDLSQSRERNIVFRWEDALNMEGDSAPYLLYVYARAKSILAKAGQCLESRSLNIVVTTEREEKLIVFLARFPEIVARAREEDAPHVIAVYLNELAQAFNRFYAEDSVLKAEGDVKATRLAIVKSVAQVIKNGLYLLNIEILERI